MKNKIAALLLLFILSLAAIIMLYRINEPFGGFMWHSEVWYTTIAQNYFTHSLLYPISELGKIDFNVPPLFSYLLFFSFKLFGMSPTSARIVPIFFSLLTIYFVYLIGKMLYNKKIGLISASLLSVSPLYILVGRSVQAEAAYLSLLIISLYFYLKANKENEIKNRLLSGLFLGCALFTKQFALLILPALFIWETLRHKNLKWLTKSHLYFLVLAIIILLPFYLFHLVKHPLLLCQAQRYGALSLAGIPSWPNLFLMVKEAWWAFSPLFFTLGLLGILFLLFKKDYRGYLLLSVILVCSLFYLFVHKHSYYIFILTPFLVLIIGRLLSTIRSQRLFLLILIILLSSSLFCTMLTLCGNKYGQTALSQLTEFIVSHEKEKPVVIMPEVSAYPEVQVQCKYLPLTGIEIETKVEVDEMSHRVILPYKRPIYFMGYLLRVPLMKTFYDKRYALVLFGRAIYQIPENIHFWRYGEVKIEKVGPWSEFGIRMIGNVPPGISIAKLPSDKYAYWYQKGEKYRLVID